MRQTTGSRSIEHGCRDRLRRIPAQKGRWNIDRGSYRHAHMCAPTLPNNSSSTWRSEASCSVSAWPRTTSRSASISPRMGSGRTSCGSAPGKRVMQKTLPSNVRLTTKSPLRRLARASLMRSASRSLDTSDGANHPPRSLRSLPLAEDQHAVAHSAQLLDLKAKAPLGHPSALANRRRSRRPACLNRTDAHMAILQPH
jgi:hypothetical protein